MWSFVFSFFDGRIKYYVNETQNVTLIHVDAESWEFTETFIF